MTGFKERKFKITGYKHRLIPLSLFSNGKSKTLAIMLPGKNYTCMHPLLRYITMQLFSLGIDVAHVNYNYDDRFFSFPDEKQDRIFYFEIEKVFKIMASPKTYSRFILVGKSLGTLAMAHLLKSGKLPRGAKLIWLTPPLDYPPLVEELRRSGGFESILFTGTADRKHFDANAVKLLKPVLGDGVHVIKGADHGLEVDDNPEKSIKVIESVLRKTRPFLARHLK